MACKSCGARTKSTQRFCEYCGAELGADAPVQTQPVFYPPQPIVVNVVNTNTNSSTNVNGRNAYDTYPCKSRWMEFFLCVFLGYLGVHRFYVGKVGSGLIYLFTGGFFGLGWVLDALRLLFGTFRDRYGHRLM